MLRLLRPAVDLVDDPGVSRGGLDSAARGDLRCQQLASLEVKLAFARGELATASRIVRWRRDHDSAVGGASAASVLRTLSRSSEPATARNASDARATGS